MKIRLLKKILKEIRIVKIKNVYYLQRKVSFNKWINLKKSRKFNNLIYYKHIEMALLLGKLGYAKKMLEKRQKNL